MRRKHVCAELPRDFCPNAYRVVCSLRQTTYQCVFALIPIFICVDIDIFTSLLPFKRAKVGLNYHPHPLPPTSTPTQLNSSLWWSHNICLWRHNGAHRYVCGKCHDWISILWTFNLKYCYILVQYSYQIILPIYLLTHFTIESSEFFCFCHQLDILFGNPCFTFLGIRGSDKLGIFFYLFINCYCYNTANHTDFMLFFRKIFPMLYFMRKKYWSVIDTQKDPICFAWYSQSDCGKFPRVVHVFKTDSMLAPSQWETSLQSNAVSHWLGANLESALCTSHWMSWYKTPGYRTQVWDNHTILSLPGLKWRRPKWSFFRWQP